MPGYVIYSQMSEILDNFNLDVDALSLSAIIKSAGQLLDRAVALQKKCAPPIAIPRQVQPCATVTENFLGVGLMADLLEELPKLDYLSTGVNQPKVCLVGEHRYTYSKETKNLLPTPLSGAPATAEVLNVVNSALQREFNSVLVNRYHSKKSKLGFHRDDEPEIVQSEGIASLSLGAQRRFQIASNKVEGEKGHFTSETQLSANSLFLMEAGFQNSYVHRVAPGRDTSAERGVRYSLTFRKLCEPGNPTPARQPSVTLPETTGVGTHLTSEEGENVVEEEEEVAEVGPHCNCYDTIVIGSSLTKGLKEAKLSNRGRKFKVICHPGAHVGTIIASVYDLVGDDGFCCDCVKDIFVVVGGNDTQNSNLESMSSIMDSFSTMLEVLRDCFLFAMVNVFSLIPRVSNDTNHLRRMNMFNESLNDVCYFHDNVKIINIFNQFLNKKELSKNIFILNNKLFSKDGIHLSHIGNSVLAKVIIGVTYNPY